MRKPLIIESNPFVSESYRKDAATLLMETGGNTGNIAFRWAVNDQVRDVRQLSWRAGAKAIREAGDIIVLPLANQLGKHTDLDSQANLLEEIGLPVIGIGLGAQADAIGGELNLTPGTLRWLETLVKLAPSNGPNLGVRGEYTRQKIEELGFANAAVVTGCPSNFINVKDDIAAKVAARFNSPLNNIAVTAGIPHIPKLAKIERDLADLVTLTGGAYIVQHGLEMIQIARGEFDKMSSETFDLARNYIQPFVSADEFRQWCNRYAHAFTDFRYWADFIRRFDFVVGTRFHGAMIAIQAGIPAGCIAHDSRTYEMCDTMGIPVIKAEDISGGITRHNLRDLFKFDPESYRAKRKKLGTAYIGMCSAAGLDLKFSMSDL